MAQQLQQQMQQLTAASMWGNFTGLNSLGPQYLAVSVGVCGCTSTSQESQVSFRAVTLSLLFLSLCSFIYSCCSSRPPQGTHSTTYLCQVDTHMHTLGNSLHTDQTLRIIVVCVITCLEIENKLIVPIPTSTSIMTISTHSNNHRLKNSSPVLNLCIHVQSATCHPFAFCEQWTCSDALAFVCVCRSERHTEPSCISSSGYCHTGHTYRLQCDDHV